MQQDLHLVQLDTTDTGKCLTLVAIHNPDPPPGGRNRHFSLKTLLKKKYFDWGILIKSYLEVRSSIIFAMKRKIWRLTPASGKKVVFTKLLSQTKAFHSHNLRSGSKSPTVLSPMFLVCLKTEKKVQTWKQEMPKRNPKSLTADSTILNNLVNNKQVIVFYFLYCCFHTKCILDCLII